MKRSLWILAASGLALAGCSLFQGPSSPEGRVGRRMHVADSLEHEGAFQKAAAEYATVAERFPDRSTIPPLSGGLR